MRKSASAVWALFWLLLAAALPLGAQQDGIAFFESQVRPVLESNCLVCHNDKLRSSGLSVLSREALLQGGNRGPAVVPGNSSASVLVKAVEYDGDLKMPPTGQLPAESITILTKWVEQGAPWGEAEVTQAGESAGPRHWSFRPIQRPDPPRVGRPEWVRTPIDSFILARLEKEGLAPSAEAGRATLIRRLSLDLLGLTPSPAEVAEFVADTRPDAYERLVDRLLASPHYGERWGRHWLDIARYADSNGYNIDGPREIWKYRDWVIDALNRDLPFNEFTIEQLAGDLLPNPTKEQIVATGFHRNTLLNLEGGIDFEQYRVEAVVDRVSTTGAAFLGLTLGCARCHDHKFDPISQREFYQFYAFFNNIDELSGEFEDREGRARAYEPILEFGTPDEFAQREITRRQIALLEKELEEYEKSLLARLTDWTNSLTTEQRGKLKPEALVVLENPPAEFNVFQTDALKGAFAAADLGYKQRVDGIRALRGASPDIVTTMVMRELPKPRQAYIHLNGDFLRKGIDVNPETLAVLPPLPKAEGAYPTRLDLARWLVSADSPLTPRVTVNRVWQRYFGRGIVATEEDFGTQGSPPSHPELLDWLASEFMARGWSLKELHRLIVTSATYRQSSVQRDELTKADPGNRLLGRQNRLRLEAEVVRDAALVASGLLTPKVGGPSVFPPQPEGAGRVTQIDRKWTADTDEDRYRRGMYTHFWRSSPHPGLMVFDAPDSTTACTRRNRSNTPLQALTLLNDEAYSEFAQGLGRRVLREVQGDEAARVRYAFQVCVAREPKPQEQKKLEEFLARQLDDFQTYPGAAKEIVSGPVPEGVTTPELAAWSAVSRVLLNLDEFITRE